MRVRDRDGVGAASDREDVVAACHGVAERGCGRSGDGGGGELALQRLEPGNGRGDIRLAGFDAPAIRSLRALEARDSALQLAEACGRNLRVSGLELQAELAVGGRTDAPLDPRDGLASARDGAARLPDLLLQLVEPEDRLRAGEVERAPRAEVG